MMKINKILSICATMALLSSGCSDDLGLQPDNAPVAGTGQTLRIAASMGNDDSRLAYNETDSEVNLSWEQGDVLKVLNPSRDELITDFSLVKGEGTVSGEFEGTPVTAYVEGDKLYALYNNNMVDTDLDEDGNVTIVLNEQNGQLNQDFQVMYGSTVYEGEDKPLEMKLENLVSIVKVTIPTDKTLASIKLTEAFRTEAKLVLHTSPSDAPNLTFNEGDLVYNYENNASNDGITVTGPFEPVDGEVTVYFYVLPTKEYYPAWASYNEMNRKPSFVAYDTDGEVYFSTEVFKGKRMEKGKMYEVNSNILKIVKFENEDVADGSEANPYEIATTEQFYTWMLHCALGHTDKSGFLYQIASYRLTGDIALDGRVPWAYINYNNATFDGNGHTISGTVYGGLFGYIGDSTIRDLILELKVINPEGSSYTNVGALSRSVYNTTILNCVNKSTINVHSDNIGGLVGSLDKSKLIGCSDCGTITFASSMDVNSVGGLVGKMGDESFIEACYSTGSITGEGGSQSLYVGGLVGMMEMDAAGIYMGTLNGCWTTSTLNVSADDITKVDPIIGRGNSAACFSVDELTSEQIAKMNGALTNSYYEFDATTGFIVAKKPSTSLPGYEIEDF